MKSSTKFASAMLAGAALVAMIGAAQPAAARTTDPGYLDYDGGATLLGPNDNPVDLRSSSAHAWSGPLGGSLIGNVKGIIPNSSSSVPGVGLGFEGVSQYNTRAMNQGFSFIPPDSMGAVGASQFMETTNGGYAIYNKSTGALQSMMSDAAFWTAAGQPVGKISGVPIANGDARVLFDSRSGKWIVESFGANLDTIQIAVSTTSDATGPWKSTSFKGYAGGIADYPTLAIDNKAVYIGTNDFSAGGSYRGETLNVINRNDLFGATPGVASLQQFFTPLSSIAGGADPGYSIQGVNQNGNSDFGKTLSVSIQGPDLIAYKVNNPGSGAATLGPVSYLGTTPYDGNNPARQPSALNPRVIDTLDDRVSSAVFENNGLIYAVHTVTPLGGDHTELVWTVSDAGTNALIQEGVISDPKYDFYQGAISVNSLGKVVLAYARSGSDPAPGNISVFAKTFNSKADGELYNTGTFLLKVSPTNDYHNGSLDGQVASGRQRWGDYAQVTVDPNDATKFWLIEEFAREPNDPANGHPGGTGGTRWGTWIAQINVGSVPEPGVWSMMIAGFGLAGAMLRRRRTTMA